MLNYTEHEIFVCDCSEISHQLVLTTWNFNDGSHELTASIKLNIFQPWYKRILIAFKYLFKTNSQNQFDSILLDDLNINKLQNSLIKFKDLQKKELVENYNF